MTDTRNVSIGPFEPGDAEAILSVFKKVFDVGRSLEEWEWEYPDNPAGLHVFLARTESGRVVSQFAGIPRRVKLGEREFVFAEIVDSLTDPDFRQGLKKPGLFARTCYAFVDHFGRPDRELVMYGLPNPPAYRVGRSLLGYGHLYHIELLTRSLQDQLPTEGDALPGACGTARLVESFGPDVDELYERFQQDKPALTVRRRPYLSWRFGHPAIAYQRYEFRDPGHKLFGIAVLRHGWLGAPLSCIVEWMVDGEHPGGPAALAYLEQAARAGGSERLQILLPPWSRSFQRLLAAGWSLEKSRFRLVARTYDEALVELSWLKDHWWITLSDFDIA